MSQLSYITEIVNVNYRGSLTKNIDLDMLQQLIPNSYQCHKPKQLIIKDEKAVIMFFSTGNFRILKCIDEIEASLIAYNYTSLIDNEEYPTIYIQSMTVKVTLNKNINLTKLKNMVTDAHYEPELFPAVTIRKFKPVSINVFSSGKIMICGVREIENITSYMDDLKEQFDACSF